MKAQTSSGNDSRKVAFRTTHWTVILNAARPDAGQSTDAFAQIYAAYWYPLYAFVRRRGNSPADAEDITQNFFLHLISKQSLDGMTREGGKFRSFLLRALENFLANQWDREHAQKRGDGQPLLSLDVIDGETKYTLRAREHDTPETIYERQWVLTLLAKVLDALASECAASGKSSLFADLRLRLQSDQQGAPYAEIASRHGLSEGAVKVTVHRLRHRYGELLREEIARTVGSPEEVDDELRHLIVVSAG